MAEEAAAPEATPKTKENRTFVDVLESLVGKKVTVINPQSFEAMAVGTKLKEGMYQGTVSGLGNDYLILSTVMEAPKKEGGQQPVRQFIPLAQIKRLSVMKTGAMIHL